jgi:hypothetical protein
MKNHLLSHKLLLRKHSMLQTIIDQLKNISQIEHSVIADLPTLGSISWLA